MMKQFIVHNAAGKILRTGRCSDSCFELQAGPGEKVIEGKANDETDRITTAGKLRRNARKKKARPQPLKVSFKAETDKQREALIAEAVAAMKKTAGGTPDVTI